MDQFQILSHLAKSLPASEQAAFIAAHQSAPSLSIRWNEAKVTHPNLTHPVPWHPTASYLTERPKFALDPLWHAGAYYVQEASSMLLYQAIVQHIEKDKPIRILDLCAAPGGKTTLVAAAMPNGSLLIANEVIRTRATILAENVQKWGNHHVWVTNNDPKHFATIENYFDVILVDAPCSGSGLFRKDADAHLEWSHDNVELCAQRQERILHDIYPSLKPGGLLVYMTCSYSQDENLGIAEKLVTDLQMQNMPLELQAEWGFTIMSSDNCIGYQAFPHKVQGEGFFLSCFRKSISTAKDIDETKYSKKDSKRKQSSDKKNFILPKQFMQIENISFFEDKENRIFAINEAHQEDLDFLNGKINLIRKGCLCGTWMKNDFIPEHDLAMSSLCTFSNRVELTLEQALEFLRRNPFDITLSEKGWYLCTYQNIPLGWLKNIGNRFNNYFPAALRLRMQ